MKPKTGGVALSMDDLRLLTWCVSVVEVILEGPDRGLGLPPMDADLLLHHVQRLREALLRPESISVKPTP